MRAEYEVLEVAGALRSQERRSRAVAAWMQRESDAEPDEFLLRALWYAAQQTSSVHKLTADPCGHDGEPLL
jgi:hypothetical protein